MPVWAMFIVSKFWRVRFSKFPVFRSAFHCLLFSIFCNLAVWYHVHFSSLLFWWWWWGLWCGFSWWSERVIFPSIHGSHSHCRWVVSVVWQYDITVSPPDPQNVTICYILPSSYHIIIPPSFTVSKCPSPSTWCQAWISYVTEVGRPLLLNTDDSLGHPWK